MMVWILRLAFLEPLGKDFEVLASPPRYPAYATSLCFYSITDPPSNYIEKISFLASGFCYSSHTVPDSSLVMTMVAITPASLCLATTASQQSVRIHLRHVIPELFQPISDRGSRALASYEGFSFLGPRPAVSVALFVIVSHCHLVGIVDFSLSIRLPPVKGEGRRIKCV